MATKKYLILINLFIFLFLAVGPVLAADGLIPCDGPKGIEQIISGAKVCNMGFFWQLVGTIIRYVVFMLMPIVATVAILIIGINILLNPEKVDARTEGKKLINTIVIGMIIIFSAYLLMQAIVNSLVNEATTVGGALKNIFNQ